MQSSRKTNKNVANKADFANSLFWIGLAIVICVESIRLGTGSFSVPGPGFIPLGSGLLLGILGFILFSHSLRNVMKGRESFLEQEINWNRLISILVSLICYGLLLDLFGFVLITLIWMGFVCRIGKMGWKMTFIVSFTTTFCCDILFGYLLGIRFPKGIVGL